ncbi:hypothetical protein KHQ86_gp173 [Gordonia phage Stormageddon]|uniref:Uncharacterized protein n=1 Tax=Gordonia phage Stormageddon TaxID=2656541 RepID=A0A649VR57_9CAUD|nr:hypothetical protein KHQ86_gp173 [Gordonia phage Stormageddon]QGJ94987.1 hypothetical protein SEA_STORMAGEDDON_127 [Gordonia phage Stormageddon]
MPVSPEELFRATNPGAFPFERQTRSVQQQYERAAQNLNGGTSHVLGEGAEEEERYRTPHDHVRAARALLEVADAMKARLGRLEAMDFATEAERQRRVGDLTAELRLVWTEAQFHATMASVSPDVYTRARLGD